MRTAKPSFDQLPLYPSEDELAEAILGKSRAKQWPVIAKAEEKAGLPRVSHLYGGRYRPAVKAFYDRRHRLIEESASTPAETEGESFDDWKTARAGAKTNAAVKRSH